MKKLVQRLLAWKARKIIEKYKPTIVAITGSVGKTSTRNAIAEVLGAKFIVRTNAENYNNEFGVPLTIIGEKSPERSVLGWLKVFWKADKLIFGSTASYPNMLVLEYGIDRPGDMNALCDIAQPDVAVLTAISPVHVENFPDVDALAQEKGTILRRVKSSGRAILNADDERVIGMRNAAAAHTMTYGFAPNAEVRGENYRLETREDFSFEPGETFSEIHLDAITPQERGPVTLSNLVGKAQASAALAAIAVGRVFDMSLSDMAARLTRVTGQAGRMRPIPGIKGSLLLDDSYNAAPAAMRAAVEVLAQFSPSEGAKRIAVLGKMAELGRYSEEEHKKLGRQIAASGVSLLVTITEPAQDIRRGAIDAGFPEAQTQHFTSSEEAGRWLDFHIKKGDIILVKGAQSARTEKVVKDLMAEPLHATELLVRQYGKWLEN